MVLLPLQLLIRLHHRSVLSGVDPDFEMMGGTALPGFRGDNDRLASGELPVHCGGRDSDPLLAAGLLEPVELGAIEELSEDLRNLRLYDARPVVLDFHHEPIRGELADLHEELRQKPTFS